jgi:O-antigen ligase
MVVVVFGGLIVAVYGIVARAVFGSLLFGRVPVPTVSPFGPFVSKNHFAGYVEMIALLAMGWALGLMDQARRGDGTLSWVGSSRAGRVVGALGVAAALALAIPVSQSRGGVLSLGAGLAALFLLRARGRNPGATPGRMWAGAATGLLVLIIALQAVLPQEAHERMATLASSSPDASGAYRLGLWRDALRAFGSSPFVGQGLAAFADTLPRFKRGAGELRVEHAESDYVELLVEGGVVAALALAAFLWLLGKSVLPSLSGDRVERGLRLGAMAGLVALALHSLVDFNLHIPASALVACLLLGMALSRKETRWLEDGRARALGFSALLAIAVAGVGLAVAASDGSVALRLEGAGRRGLRARRAEVGVRTHLRARPADAEAWVWLAWLRANASVPDEGAALAGYASGLDPTREPLRASAAALEVPFGPKTGGQARQPDGH